MLEILVFITLLIPPADEYVSWTINQIPTQIELIHKTGISVSYHSTEVECGIKPGENQLVLEEDSDYAKRCYMLLDTMDPQFVRRSPEYWLNVEMSAPKGQE